MLPEKGRCGDRLPEPPQLLQVQGVIAEYEHVKILERSVAVVVMRPVPAPSAL